MRRRTSLRTLATAVVLITLGATRARAQSQFELWGDFTLDWVQNPRLTFSVDVEPKTSLTSPGDQPGFWTIQVTPNVQFAARNWLDVVGETLVGYTGKSNDDNSTQVTPRAGVLVHVLSRNVPDPFEWRERPPRRRVVIRDLSRLEWENTFDEGAKSGSSFALRWRNRVEFQVPLNKPGMTVNGAQYFTSDWETFMPLDDGSDVFVDKQRVRAGLGYRRSFRWRFEALYIWDLSRKAAGDPFVLSDQAIDLRVKRVF